MAKSKTKKKSNLEDRISLRLDEKLLAKIDKKRGDVSRSLYIRKVLKENV
jgi:metal-responsive CopG/Arc/MetJ family transcriptional regulator